MMIQNFSQLASTALRKKALLIAEAGLEAIATTPRVRAAVRYNKHRDELFVEGRRYKLASVRRLVVVGFGKAAYEAVTTLYSILGDRISEGLVVDLKGDSVGTLTTTVGSHPYPSATNVTATKHILEVVTGMTAEDMVLCVVSGGGSSLLCYPYKQTCELQSSIVQALMHSGATIQELNTVRKHMSLVNGGQLAAAAYPATVINLVFSDVPGDDPALVASGPTLYDPTTSAEAEAVLQKYAILEKCGLSKCDLHETPKEEKYFASVHTHVLVSGKLALRAMSEKAENLGFATKIASAAYAGIAKELAVEFAGMPKKRQCVLAAGESTVVVKHAGKGGRNLEMALAALPQLGQDHVFLALDTDGHDNTPCAGAIVDAHTRDAAQRVGMSPVVALEQNGSYQFFEAVGDYIATGLTGANVADFVVSIRD